VDAASAGNGSLAGGGSQHAAGAANGGTAGSGDDGHDAGGGVGGSSTDAANPSDIDAADNTRDAASDFDSSIPSIDGGATPLIDASSSSSDAGSQPAIDAGRGDAGDATVSCDPSGTYLIMGSPVSYACCGGLVSLNVSSIFLAYDDLSAQLLPTDPGLLTGDKAECPDGDFVFTRVLGGGCAVTYTLNGGFESADTWSGTLDLSFAGADCALCAGLGSLCMNSSFAISASR
jgi:hypothetical protein